MKNYDNIIWTINLKCLSLEEIKKSEKFYNVILLKDWLREFGVKELYTSDLSTTINYLPNFIRIKLMSLLNNQLMTLPIINFKEF